MQGCQIFQAAAGGSGVDDRHGLAWFNSGRFGWKYFIRKKRIRPCNEHMLPTQIFFPFSFKCFSHWRQIPRNRCEHLDACDKIMTKSLAKKKSHYQRSFTISHNTIIYFAIEINIVSTHKRPVTRTNMNFLQDVTCLWIFTQDGIIDKLPLTLLLSSPYPNSVLREISLTWPLKNRHKLYYKYDNLQVNITLYSQVDEILCNCWKVVIVLFTHFECVTTGNAI